jgi:hypothetical protein
VDRLRCREMMNDDDEEFDLFGTETRSAVSVFPSPNEEMVYSLIFAISALLCLDTILLMTFLIRLNLNLLFFDLFSISNTE